MPAAPPPLKPKAPPPSNQKPSSPTPAPVPNNGRFRVRKLAKGNVGERIVIYGEGGIGKTTLALAAPKSRIIDLDKGANRVPGAEGVEGVETWSDLIDAVRDESLWEGCDTLIIDSATEAEELAVKHTLQTVKHEKTGLSPNSVEAYGYGKGYQFVYETFMQLLSGLDKHFAAGRNVVLVCHSTIALAPNPTGEDYQRHEPKLQQPSKVGRTRDRVKNWCDHMIFIGYDVHAKDGKGKGSGSRTIYTREMPTHWAKSRCLPEAPILFAKGSTELWSTLFGKESHAAS